MPRTRKENESADAIELLKQDHRKVEELFKQFEELEDEPEAANPIIETAVAELQVHDKLEMEVFYPAVRDAGEDDDEIEDLLDEAEVEHETVRELIEKINEGGLDDEMRKARFTVLLEYVKHHVEEEEKEMFPKVRKLKGLDLDALGEEMQERKAEIMSEMGIEASEEEEATS